MIVLRPAALYKKATGGEMSSQLLTAHRATDDAKAERLWMQRLPEFSEIMVGTSRKACGISMEKYREYDDQYELYGRKDAELARLQAEEVLLSSQGGCVKTP